MADQMLTALLKASLDAEDGKSPLVEADPAALDELYDRINSKLAAGMPETIDLEKDLLPIVLDLQAHRFKFVQDQQRGIRAGGGPRKKKAVEAEPAQELELDGI